MKLFFTIPQGHVAVVTRFGKFARVMKAGLHTRIAFLEKIHYVRNWGNIANKDGYLIELAEQISDTTPKQCHSKDNVPVTIDASIYWRITDVSKALFEVDNLPQSIKDTCLNALRSEIGKLTLDQILSTRGELSERVAASLLYISAKWGVEISRVEIQELQTSKDTAEAMGMEMEAERRKRASVLDAEGSAEAKRKEADATAYALQKEAEANAFAMQKAAEAEAYAIRARAEAEAEYIKSLTEQLGKEEVSKIMMLDKVLSAYRAIASESSNKVFLPANIKTLISDMADEAR